MFLLNIFSCFDFFFVGNVGMTDFSILSCLQKLAHCSINAANSYKEGYNDDICGKFLSRRKS